MKREEMVCEKCLNYEASVMECRNDPIPNMVINPGTYWCAQGAWQEWSERYREMEPYSWGEWETEEPQK